MDGFFFLPFIHSLSLQVWNLVRFQWKFIQHMAAFLKNSDFPQASPLSLTPEDGLSTSLMTEHHGPAWGGPRC